MVYDILALAIIPKNVELMVIHRTDPVLIHKPLFFGGSGPVGLRV